MIRALSLVLILLSVVAIDSRHRRRALVEWDESLCVEAKAPGDDNEALQVLIDEVTANEELGLSDEQKENALVLLNALAYLDKYKACIDDLAPIQHLVSKKLNAGGVHVRDNYATAQIFNAQVALIINELTTCHSAISEKDAADSLHERILLYTFGFSYTGCWEGRCQENQHIVSVLSGDDILKKFKKSAALMHQQQALQIPPTIDEFKEYLEEVNAPWKDLLDQEAIESLVADQTIRDPAAVKRVEDVIETYITTEFIMSVVPHTRANAAASMVEALKDIRGSAFDELGAAKPKAESEEALTAYFLEKLDLMKHMHDEDASQFPIMQYID